MTTLLPHKFGPYGGQFVPETLMPALIELEEAFVSAKADPAFQQEFNRLMASFVGRELYLSMKLLIELKTILSSRVEK